MAQTNSFVPQYNHGYIANQQPSVSNAFVVVDQQPFPRQGFPYSLHLKWILGISIFKCILGSLLFITGICEVALLKYDLKIAFAIWCGLTILANGIVGCVLKCKQNKCLKQKVVQPQASQSLIMEILIVSTPIIGAFLALSITSFIFDISMLTFYSVILEYFDAISSYYCSPLYYPYYRYYCYGYMSRGDKDLGIGLTAFLVTLACCEFFFSIGSIVVSCKAYSKCCNTCDPNDCCTCLGCCECDSYSLHTQQGIPLNGVQSIQPGAFQYNHPNQSQFNTDAQSLPAYNAQGVPSNPCSDLVRFVINMPSYIFGGANGTQLSAINVNIQPLPSSQHDSVSQPPRSGEPVQAITFDETQQNPTHHA